MFSSDLLFRSFLRLRLAALSSSCRVPPFLGSVNFRRVAGSVNLCHVGLIFWEVTLS